jgi:hypothetical protein
MIHYLRIGVVVLTIVVIVGGCGAMGKKVDSAEAKARIEQVIRNSITWAMNKDRDLLYRSFVNDSTLFYFSPDNAGNIKGFDQFTKLVDRIFMNPAFRAISSDFRDMQIDLARSGDVAWWSCFLDDFNEWNGAPSNWKNVRWTGVLEKRDGHWVIMQMHFSYSVEDMQATMKKVDDSTKAEN